MDILMNQDYKLLADVLIHETEHYNQNLIPTLGKIYMHLIKSEVETTFSQILMHPENIRSINIDFIESLFLTPLSYKQVKLYERKDPFFRYMLAEYMVLVIFFASIQISGINRPNVDSISKLFENWDVSTMVNLIRGNQEIFDLGQNKELKFFRDCNSKNFFRIYKESAEQLSLSIIYDSSFF